MVNLSTSIPPDLLHFIQITANGRFYEEFAAIAGVTRDVAKDKIFGVIFSENGGCNNGVKRAFIEWFPTAWCLMVAEKKRDPGPDGYKVIAAKMQTMESDLIIRGVGEVLRLDYPEVPVATVHDSYLTTDEHLPLVRSLMEDQFRRFPVLPKFREKGVLIDGNSDRPVPSFELS